MPVPLDEAPRDLTGQPEGLMLELVTFGAGGHRYGLVAASVRAMTASCRGTVRSVEQVLNVPDSVPVQGPRVFLELRDAPADVLLAVTPPVELRRVPAGSVHPVPTLIAARSRLATLRALVLDGAALVALVEIPDSWHEPTAA